MHYPALDVTGADTDLLEALVDDYAPTALTAIDRGVRIFFATAADRDRAQSAVSTQWPAATVVAQDVDDEDWARRSQQNLTPITVGRVVVTPPWHARLGPGASSPAASDPPIEVVITPSMGFGTGHHATTRLCLAALQALPLSGRTMLDIGTGSGVLALAARALGAATAVGIDYDPDAIQAATENLERNPSIDQVRFVTGDLRDHPVDAADVVTANLMGALLVQTASLLLSFVRAEGRLIVSGLLDAERDAVSQAFTAAGAVVAAEAREEGWVALTLAVPATQ